jgi:hypothetical protein
MTEYAAKLRFRRRPSPVLPDHRPLYKVGQILLILHLASHGGKSKLPRLHLLNWSLKLEERQAQLIEATKKKVLKVEAWGFDPALAIALRFGLAEKLLEDTSTGYKISESGLDMAKQLMQETEVLSQEKKFLCAIGKGITEAMVEAISNGWGKS